MTHSTDHLHFRQATIEHFPFECILRPCACATLRWGRNTHGTTQHILIKDATLQHTDPVRVHGFLKPQKRTVNWVLYGILEYPFLHGMKQRNRTTTGADCDAETAVFLFLARFTEKVFVHKKTTQEVLFFCRATTGHGPCVQQVFFFDIFSGLCIHLSWTVSLKHI